MISVIIPIHNGDKYIDNCMRSVLDQTHKDIEILLINDGSTDDSSSICDTYSSKYDHVTAIHTVNGGPSSARNIGIQACGGDLIYFLDVDDSINSHALELLFGKYKEHDVDLVIGDFYRVIDGVKKLSGNELTHPGDTLLDRDGILSYLRKYLRVPYKYILFNHCWNRLYKTSIIRENDILFDPDLRNLEDIDFNFKYLNYVNRAFYKSYQTYNYTIRNTSQSFIIGDDLNDVVKYPSTFQSIKTFLRNSFVDESDVVREVGHMFISYTIIILIRLCGNWRFKNSYKVYRNVSSIISSPSVRDNLSFYSPTEDDVKFIHVLIKYRLSLLTMITCRKRYNTHRKFTTKRK